MTEARLRVLVVDDEENIRFLIGSALRLEGFDVILAPSGREALALIESNDLSLVILDVMLDDLIGFEVLRRMRAAGHEQPVILLTARDGVHDRIRGLTVGGDDYVVKPFAVEELLARVRVVLRRSGGLGDGVLRYADLALDDDAHLVTRGERQLQLSPTEYRLLRYLLTNAGQALPRARIFDHVWEYDGSGDSTVLDSFISSLRRKVDRDGDHLIQTVRGIGYALRQSSSSDQ
jgi:two-component system OmpR family response regulator